MCDLKRYEQLHSIFLKNWLAIFKAERPFIKPLAIYVHIYILVNFIVIYLESYLTTLSQLYYKHYDHLDSTCLIVMAHPFNIPGIAISVTVQAILRIFMDVVTIIL